MPPTCSTVPTSTAVWLYPIPVTTVGSQFDSEYRISRFMKFTTQSSSVTVPRPSRNRCTSGTPDRRLLVGDELGGRIDANRGVELLQPARQLVAPRPLTARNCSDSGRPQNIATAMTSGTAPPKKNTERQPKSGISHSGHEAADAPRRR